MVHRQASSRSSDKENANGPRAQSKEKKQQGHEAEMEKPRATLGLAIQSAGVPVGIADGSSEAERTAALGRKGKKNSGSAGASPNSLSPSPRQVSWGGSPDTTGAAATAKGSWFANLFNWKQQLVSRAGFLCRDPGETE
jgi:hypothetical protein